MFSFYNSSLCCSQCGLQCEVRLGWDVRDQTWRGAAMRNRVVTRERVDGMAFCCLQLPLKLLLRQLAHSVSQHPVWLGWSQRKQHFLDAKWNIILVTVVLVNEHLYENEVYLPLGLRRWEQKLKFKNLFDPAAFTFYVFGGSQATVTGGSSTSCVQRLKLSLNIFISFKQW